MVDDAKLATHQTTSSIETEDYNCPADDRKKQPGQGSTAQRVSDTQRNYTVKTRRQNHSGTSGSVFELFLSCSLKYTAEKQRNTDSDRFLGQQQKCVKEVPSPRQR